MVHYAHLIACFFRASIQQEMAYRSNFFISLLNSGLNLGGGLLGLAVLFGQVQVVQGWSFSSALALLGVYLLLEALRGLVIGPSFGTLAGLDGEVWSGRFDFTVLRPVDIQFMVSLRDWRMFKLVDLLLALGVLGVAAARLGGSLRPPQVLAFLLALSASLVIVYAILLAFTALIFWSPGFLFTWVFDGLVQMARYPVGVYPGWLRFVLTWVVPVGVMTTIPAQALAGELSLPALIGSLMLALLMALGASALFRRGLRRYASASS